MNGVKVRDGIELRAHRFKGRGLFAISPFPEGSIVFDDYPLVSCQFAWNQDLAYKACDQCMGPLETAEQNTRRLAQMPDLVLPPPADTLVKPEMHTVCECQVVYCSTGCKVLASGMYHGVLCAPPGSDKAQCILKLREDWKKMHYPPETATAMILLRIYANMAMGGAAAVDDFENFVSDSSNPAVCEKLLGKFKDKVETLRASVAECVQGLNLEIPPDLLTPEGFMKTLSILALNGQGIGTGSFTHWVQLADDPANQALYPDNNSFIESLYQRMEETVGTEFLENEGSGLYVLQSKLNHSCDPNLEVTFPSMNHVVGLRALRDISAEEELTISYADACSMARSRHSRQKLLKEQYLFECLCHKCEQGVAEPDVTSDEEDDDEDMSDS